MIAMRRPRPVVAAALAAAVASGCVLHGRHHYASYVGNGALVGAGALFLADRGSGCPDGPDGMCSSDSPPIRTNDLIGGTLVVAGVIGVVLTVLDHDSRRDDRPAPPPPLRPTVPAAAFPPAPASAPAVDPSLAAVRDLTDQARDEARLGHCDTVVGLGERVFQLAPAFHAQVFVRDPVIARCLPPPGPPGGSTGAAR